MSRRKLKKVKYYIIFVGLLLCLYPFAEQYWVQTKTITYIDKDIPEAFKGFKVVFLSDIHHGPSYSIKRVRKLVEKVNKLKPDVILLGGDYVSQDSKYIEPCFSEFKNLKALHGVYGVMGNHDHYEGAKLTSEHMSKAGIIQLDNKAVSLDLRGSKIRIGGVGDLWEDNQDLSPTISGTKLEDFVLLMSHNPDFVEKIDTDKIDLVLSGHTHGGQVTLFGLWAPIIPSNYGQKYRTGIIETDNTKVLVTNGIGNAMDYPVRFFAKPQINVIYLDN